MPTPSEQLLSRTIYDIDGTTTVWDFSFAGGYLDAAHVKAYTELPTGARTTVVVTPEMLIGEFQLQITPALSSSAGVLVIYRDTPKNLPLVDFVEGPLSEIALDTNAKQAVFIAAEAQDVNTASDTKVQQAVQAAVTATEQAALAGGYAVAADSSADLALAAQLDIQTNWGDKLAAADASADAAAASQLAAATSASNAQTARLAAEGARDTALSTATATATAAAASATVAAGASAAAAQADRVLAQAAATTAFVNADVYASVAAAQADTGLANGSQYQIVSPDGLWVLRYRKDSSSASTWLVSYPSGEIFLDGFGRSGWAYTVGDAENNIAIGVRPDGSFAIGLEEDVGAAIPGARLATANFYDRPNGDGHVFGIVDEDENLGFVMLADGRVLVGGLEVANKPQQDLLSAAVFGSRFITCWGDSLTEGAGSTSNQTYPVQLAALAGLSTINEGFGGQVARQIVCRQGGAATLVTVAGNLIPASGSVSVTVDVNLLAYPSAQSFSTVGTLLGVLGTLTKDTGNAYTFTRSTAGTAVICPPLTPFAVTQSTRNTSARNLDQGINIFWCGSNDVATDSITGVAGYIDLAVAKLQQSEKRFFVLGPIANSSVTSSSGSYAPMRAEVAKLRAKYPRNFIDIHEILIENYNPAIPQDVTDYANRVTPSSLRSDAIHLNNAGYAIVANTIFNHIKSKGWL